MSNLLRLDVTRMMSDVVGDDHGIKQSDIKEIWPRVTALLQGLEAKRKAGDLPFYDLPDDTATVDRIIEYSDQAKTKYKNLVVLGIGGSALGPVALKESLRPYTWNLLPEEKRDGLRLFVPDNPDPDFFGSILDLCPPEETLYNVVTKSGGTAETVSSYLAVLTLLKENLKDQWRDHLVFTTDPSKGNLRKIARSEGIVTFSIPSGVGGRFSVLTPVGLLPAALIGIDIRKLLAGSADQRERVFNRTFEENPSAAFAVLQYIADTRLGKNIQVMMPYTNALFRTADWFRQLWAESLGKRENLSGDIVACGPTPIASLGATDQHSQVQLYVEGPNNKTFTFLVPDSFHRKVICGKHHADMEGIDYLAGIDIGALLRSEAEATQRAITAANRPNMTFHFDMVTPEVVGGLMYLFEAATLVAGGLYEVNPLDQPGVEAGKIATYALLGRDGYEDIRVEIENDQKRDSIIIS